MTPQVENELQEKLTRAKSLRSRVERLHELTQALDGGKSILMGTEKVNVEGIGELPDGSLASELRAAARAVLDKAASRLGEQYDKL